MKTPPFRLIPLLSLSLSLPGYLVAGIISGPLARTDFESYRDNFGGTYLDFTPGVAPMPSNNRLQNELEASHGVGFSTFQNFNLNPIGPHNVIVSPVAGGSIVGTPSAGSGEDGRYPYQIIFTSPQRYAGIHRYWPNTVTEFYDLDNNLLGWITNTASNFNGYLAPTSDSATWVSRMVMTGNVVGGSRQVGYSDDLFFGTTIPEPRAYALAAALLAGLAVAARHRRRRAA